MDKKKKAQTGVITVEELRKMLKMPPPQKIKSENNDGGGTFPFSIPF